MEYESENNQYDLSPWLENTQSTIGKRAKHIGIILIIAICTCVGWVIYKMSGEYGDKWRAKGKEIHRPKEINIQPLRGTIYAADGRPVALTATTYRLYFDFQAGSLELLHRPAKDSLEQLKKDSLSKQLTRDLDLLAKLLTEHYKEQGITINKQKLREQWKKGFLSKSNRYIPLLDRDISYLDYQWLYQQEPLKSRTEETADGKKKKIPSLLRNAFSKEERGNRIKPFGSLASRSIGSIYGEKQDGLSKGSFGIELGFDSLLRGQIGKGIKIFAASRTNTQITQPAVDGYNIYTTLNMNVQSQLERIMRKQLGHFNAQSGTAILLDVPTGKVLSITNLKRTKDGNYIEAENYAVNNTSEPGSTFKVASMLVALNNNLVNPNDSIDVGNGTWVVGKRTVRDHNAHHGGYGKLSISEVIENSSNVGIAKIIHRNFSDKPGEYVNQKKYVKQIRDLAFGYDLRVEIPGSERAQVKMPNKKNWWGTSLAWMSFGYETRIPPMYIAAFFNAIANGGKLMKPYLVQEVRDKDNNIIEHYAPKVIREQIGTPKSIQQIQDMLRRVVTHGTGKRSINSNIVAISGKSGTAQIAQNGSYRGSNGISHQVSFCGYFPSESPRYTLMVVIREPSKEFAAGGGSMAGPVVKELAETIISMETPSSLDSLTKMHNKVQAQHISIGRKNEIMKFMLSTKQTYKAQAKISQDSYIQLDSLGRESAIPTYPMGYIPNVTGMGVVDANYLLMKQGYKPTYIGYGKVISQTPSAGTKATYGTTISLHLGQ